MERQMDEYGISSVAVYSRVSTAQQRYRHGLTRQRSSAEEFCQAAGYTIACHSYDVMTGTAGPGYGKDQRRGLAEAIDFIRAGCADALLVESPDRLFRDQDAYLRVMMELSGHRIPTIWTWPTPLIYLPAPLTKGRVQLFGGDVYAWRGVAMNQDSLSHYGGQLPRGPSV